MAREIRWDNIRPLSEVKNEAALRAHAANEALRPPPPWPAVDGSWWDAVIADPRHGGAGALRKVDPELGMALHVDGKYHRFLRAPVIRHVLLYFRLNPHGEIVFDPYSARDVERVDKMLAALPSRSEIAEDIRWINLCVAVNGQRARLVGR